MSAAGSFSVLLTRHTRSERSLSRENGLLGFGAVTPPHRGMDKKDKRNETENAEETA